LSKWIPISLLAAAWFSLGCESALPHTRTVTDSPWEHFNEAQAAFDSIEVGKTTATDLEELGFHPYRGENVAIIDYMDIYRTFLPNASTRMEDQPEGVQACIEARSGCEGWRTTVLREFDREYGGFWSNFFAFRTKTEVTGWIFDSLLVLVDDEVVYKLWEGNPAITKRSDRVRPLGPFQDPDFRFGLTFP
jgi:hypothetical protein